MGALGGVGRALGVVGYGFVHLQLASFFLGFMHAVCNWGCMGNVRGIWGIGLRRLFVIKTATSAKPVSELGLFPGIWEFILGIFYAGYSICLFLFYL
jgi:hypothetical protein